MTEYVVGLNRGVDYDAVWAEIEASTGHGAIPNRAVDIVNERPLSQRQCHYELSDQEAELLRQDPRVKFVVIPAANRDDIEIHPCARQTGNYSKVTGAPTNEGNSGVNWGLFRCNSRDNNTAATDNFASANYDYPLDGTGVDIVIQDTGCQVDHPEFQDAQGVSRVQQINWWTAAGRSGQPPWTPDPTQNNMPSGFYTDTNGHGTHVTGIAAGKTYGRAKNARIYIMNILGSEEQAIDPATSFDLIRGWHNNKPVDPETGFRRPTVVNMSWGRFYNPLTVGLFINGRGIVNYRGGNYNWPVNSNYNLNQLGFSPWALILGENYYDGAIPARNDDNDMDIEECIDAGIIMVGAAGNNGQSSNYEGSVDYNNYFSIFNSGIFSPPVYYMRGSTPGATDGVISVGNVDVNNTPQLKAFSSTCGPRIDVWAPGTNIVSACSTVYDPDGFSGKVADYPQNTNYKIANISGTSMASPQVAGIAAQWLQVYPGATPAQIRSKIINDSTQNQLYSGISTNYGDAYSLCGAPNRYAYQPLSSNQTHSVSGDAVGISGYISSAGS